MQSDVYETVGRFGQAVEHTTKMNVISIHYIVIVYNKLLSSSATICSLRAVAASLFRARITIWDNSIGADYRDQNLRLAQELLGEMTFAYLPCLTNMGLAEVYNRVIATSDAEVFCILDDDSALPSDYFEEIQKVQLSAYATRLVLPRVLSKGRIYSPAKRWMFLGYHPHSIKSGSQPARNCLAVASGMLVSRAVYDEVGPFNERLNLYGIDTDYLVRYQKKFRFLLILEAQIQHSLAMLDGPNLHERRRRILRSVIALRQVYRTAFLGLRVLLQVYTWYVQLRFLGSE